MEMDPHRRITRSTSNITRNPGEPEGAFWGRMIDPTDIERDRAEAIRAARRAASDDPSALLNTTQDEQVGQEMERNQRSLMDTDVPTNLLEEEIPFTSNLTNYTEQSLRMVNNMRTTFVDNSPSTTERVTTPVDMDITGASGPLDPAFTRPSLQTAQELDAQPTKGPKELGNVTNDLLDQYMDENYTDVLRTSLLNPSSYLSLPSVKKSPPQVQQKTMAMDWYLPDGSNRRLVEVQETRIADFRSPGGGTGALVMTLAHLMLQYQTTKYLVDLDTGEMFGWIANQWRQTGLYCSAQPFVLKELTARMTRCSEALRMDLEQEQQTRVIQLSKEGGQVNTPLPSLPMMPDPEAYINQPDAMTPQMRRNYVRDRTQAALTYLKEYETSSKWEQEPRYEAQQVRQRLQIIYGKADKVRNNIDTALLNDDIYRRRRVMRTLDLPQRFPLPQNMKNSPVETWVQWIRDESNKLIAAIDEEITRCQDPDDPFDGTASGIFPPLQNIAASQQGVTQGAQSIKPDESRNHSPQAVGTTQEKLVDIQTPLQRQAAPPLQDHRQRTLLPGEPQSPQNQVQASDSSQSRTGNGEKQEDRTSQTGQPSAITSTQRRIEESQQEILFENEQQADDPFRTLRSFHEKQREERQGEDQPRTSVTSHSTLEGAVGGTVTQHPKPQRQTQKNQSQGNSQQKTAKQQGNNQPSQSNFYQGTHNTTTYMELPSSIQSKICGRCGLMGHIRRFCKEEVYCKHCRMPTHSTTACRTYPSTSSRKNTPEKRTPEEIDHEVNRRVQEGMLRILTELSTNRQVVDNQGAFHFQQGVSNQPEDSNTPYQHIPEQRHGPQNQIDDLQRPPEVFEQQRVEPSTVGQGEEGHNQNPILDQQWGEQLHQQPPLRPTSLVNTQVRNDVNQVTGSSATAEANVKAATIQRRIEESREENQVQQGSAYATTNVHPNRTDPATNRQVEQTSCAQCNCHCQASRGTVNSAPVTESRRFNLHTEYEDRSSGGSNFFRGKKQNEEKSSRECQIIRILPEEDDDYMDIIRNSVSSQNRKDLKPMFVNNFFAGDNNWRTVPQATSETARHFDESKSRASTGVQTAVSFLGEEDKNLSILQAGLARMKSMGVNGTECKAQPPVVVEPTKPGNTTSWSTHSFNIPNPQQDISRQQCKGYPDFTVPPPTIQTSTTTPSTPQTPCKQEESAILRVIEKMTETMDQQMKLSATRADYNMQQNTKMMEQFIRAQDRRDLDPALMDIPTFTGQEPEKCLEWITRIRNVCRQSGRSFRQELTNKSGLVVQNFLSSLDTNITENDLVERVLQMFSDIPTTTQAITKLKEMRQAENESILAFNQRYKTLVERVEGRPIENITSPVAMEMYLGTIILPLRRSIKNSIFWGSKHAPTTVGEAMTKAQQLSVKHLYAAGEETEENQSKPTEDVVINEISQKFQNRYQGRRDDFRDSSRNRQDSYEHRQWQQYGGRRNSNYSANYQSSPTTGAEDHNKQRRFDTSTNLASNSQQGTDRQQPTTEKSDESTRRQNRGEANQNSVLRGGYTQILVNPMQLTDAEFTLWLEKLVEARKNRQERKPRPYRNFRKPYNNDQSEFKKPPLRNKLQPAQELDVQNIMDMFHCEYDDIVEAVDLYNMDVEESQMA